MSGLATALALHDRGKCAAPAGSKYCGGIHNNILLFKMLSRSGDVQMDLHDYACLSMPRLRPAARDRHRTPHGRSTSPSRPHTAASVVPGENTGTNPKTRRVGIVERNRPRSPIYRGIAKTRKSQYNTATTCARTYPRTAVFANVLLFMMGGRSAGVLLYVVHQGGSLGG